MPNKRMDDEEALALIREAKASGSSRNAFMLWCRGKRLAIDWSRLTRLWNES